MALFIGYHAIITLETLGVVFSTEMNFLKNPLCCSCPFVRGFSEVDSSHLGFLRAHERFVNSFNLYQEFSLRSLLREFLGNPCFLVGYYLGFLRLCSFTPKGLFLEQKFMR